MEILFVWMVRDMYTLSISHRYGRTILRIMIISFLLMLYIGMLIPKWKYVFLSSPRHLNLIAYVVRLVQSGHRLREENLLWVQKFDSYLYHAFNRKLNVIDRLHLSFLSVYLRLLIKCRLNNRASSEVLRLLL